MTDDTGHFSKYTQLPFYIQENGTSVLSILNVFRWDTVKVVEYVCTHRNQRRLQSRDTLHSISDSLLSKVWHKAWHLLFITKGIQCKISVHYNLQLSIGVNRKGRCLRWIGMDRCYAILSTFTKGQYFVYSVLNAFICVYMLYVMSRIAFYRPSHSLPVHF